ncbi:MAG: hypothetical protein ACE5G8_02150 [Anaerolineae bacterium]
MVSEHNQTQTLSLEVLSLTVGVMLGGAAAIILMGLLMLATLQPGVNAAAIHWPHLLPANWQTGLVTQIKAMGFPLQGETSAYWYMSRASALLAYLLIWASTLWGLLLSTKIVKSKLPAPLAFSMHEFLSLLGLGFAAFHAFILLGDRYIGFSLSQILLPFSASFEPGWVGVGTISLYLYGLIILSFYLKKRIGQKAWRSLHYLTFAAYVMTIAHSLPIGTDSGLTAMRLMYLASAGSVLFLVYYRILDSASRPARKKRRR